MEQATEIKRLEDKLRGSGLMTDVIEQTPYATELVNAASTIDASNIIVSAGKAASEPERANDIAVVKRAFECLSISDEIKVIAKAQEQGVEGGRIINFGRLKQEDVDLADRTVKYAQSGETGEQVRTNLHAGLHELMDKKAKAENLLWAAEISGGVSAQQKAIRATVAKANKLGQKANQSKPISMEAFASVNRGDQQEY
jgi:hypothetical protein